MTAAEVASDAAALARRLADDGLSEQRIEGRRKVEEWLEQLDSSSDAGALRAVLKQSAAARSCLTAIADGSPFLWDLAHRAPARLLAILRNDPDRHFEQLLSNAVSNGAALDDMARMSALLRHLKAEAALLIAFCDIGRVWELPRITQALTRVADTALLIALRFLLREAAATGKLRPADPEEPERGSGYFILAMGKMGAFELNYSSDIDLIVLFDPATQVLAAGIEPGPFFVRVTRSLVKLLQERTVDGYVFRVDLRLRPDPGMTQIALSSEAALGYYESVGLNWERAAMIKARPCAGDIVAGEHFLRQLSPFVWRKYLDYAAVAHVHDMKRQISAFRGHDEVAVQGHNVKIGRGGIREIEFFVQTQQLIAGGRNPRLRGRETLPMLHALADGGWISPEAAAELETAYRFLRTVEHRLQMVSDEQTHSVPSQPEEFERFVRFMGYADVQAFCSACMGQFNNVQRHYASLFENASSTSRLNLNFPPDEDDRETLDQLVSLGFRKPLEASALVRGWLAGAYGALRGDVARERMAELAPLLIEHFARSDNPDAVLQAFDRFLAGLRGGARLLSLLLQNRGLIALITSVLGLAPRLSDILAHHPQVMDTLIDPAFFGALPEGGQLDAYLTRSLEQAASFEDYLDRARLFRQEQLFLIGTRIISGTVSAQQAGEAFARLAEVLICMLHKAVGQRFEEAHGRIRGGETAILAMGKLGGREMTASSDLDLILIYDFDAEHPESDGAKPLYGAQYFARLTQRIIGSLTAQTNYGALYHVDMRLRPSGRSGPVATHIDGFRSYQRDEAWTWEHMALTRARVVSASSEAFAARVQAAVSEVLQTQRDRETLSFDVREMRNAIAAEKGEGERWDLKYAAGGIIDLEFIAQYLQLAHASEAPAVLNTQTLQVFEAAQRLDLLSTEDAELLRGATRLMHDLTQILRLCLNAPFNPENAGAELLRLLARAGDLPDFNALHAHLADTQARVRQAFQRLVQ
jgi:[glutamine synthetase] adenylyltransferase / [glutamine synthetase]-adenylyl-L-tyrosine phosphorylase